MTPDDRARLHDIAERIWRIRAYSATNPHLFFEQKDEVARELLAFANAGQAELVERRANLPGRFVPGTIVSSKGRTVRVERRRAA